jgi:penicillin-binding protein A
VLVTQRSGMHHLVLAVAVALFGSSAAFAEGNVDPPEQVPAVRLERIELRDHQAVAPAGELWASLTLDVELQRQAQRQLARARPQQGAIVALDVVTGQVLVWAETRAESSLLYEAQAPAASLFKLVTTMALFERGGVLPQSRVCTNGGQHGIYRRHLEKATGPEALCTPFSQALGHSRNAVYAQLASQHLLRSDLVEIAGRIGFNGLVPFDVDVELGSLDVPYNDLEFARTAAGFTGSRLTPLGAAYLAFLVANRGRAARLSIVKSLGAYRAPEARQDLERVFSESTAHRLVRMMEVTVHSGTSLGAFSDEQGQSYLGSVRVAGKTGTLQLERGSPTTSWFTGFAPSRKPRIVIAVLLQNGRIWHRKANEVARDVLRQYFAQRGFWGVAMP